MAKLGPMFDDLLRVEIVLWNEIDARLRADHDLTLGRFQVMQVISRMGSCRGADIARSMRITEGGVSKLVAKIVDAGHCVREADPVDGRASIVSLTPRGESKLADAEITFEGELRARIAELLDSKMLTQFAKALVILRTSQPS